MTSTAAFGGARSSHGGTLPQVRKPPRRTVVLGSPPA